MTAPFCRTRLSNQAARVHYIDFGSGWVAGGGAAQQSGWIRSTSDHVHLSPQHVRPAQYLADLLSLEKDPPVSRAVERPGHILCRPILGGLHHQYIRI